MKIKSLMIILALFSTSTLVGLIGFAPVANAAIELTPGPTSVTDTTSVKEDLSICSDDNGPIYITWAERMADGYTDILLSYSSNNGTSFSPTITVNNNTLGQQTSPTTGVTSNGDLLIAWQDGYSDGGDIMLSRSEDMGMTYNETSVSTQND